MCLLLVLNNLGTVFIGDDFYMSVSTGIKQQRHHVKSLKLGDKLNLSVASIENILVIVWDLEMITLCVIFKKKKKSREIYEHLTEI